MAGKRYAVSFKKNVNIQVHLQLVRAPTLQTLRTLLRTELSELDHMKGKADADLFFVLNL
jgi:hypothetical protein